MLTVTEKTYAQSSDWKANRGVQVPHHPPQMPMTIILGHRDFCTEASGQDIKIGRKAGQQRNSREKSHGNGLKKHMPELLWGPRHRSCWPLAPMGPGNFRDSQSPGGTVQNGWGGGTTHAVVASFVVLILGFYMNGEFRQKGTLWEKSKVH